MGDRFSLPLVLFHLVDWQVCGRTSFSRRLRSPKARQRCHVPCPPFSNLIWWSLFTALFFLSSSGWNAFTVACTKWVNLQLTCQRGEAVITYCLRVELREESKQVSDGSTTKNDASSLER